MWADTDHFSPALFVTSLHPLLSNWAQWLTEYFSVRWLFSALYMYRLLLHVDSAIGKAKGYAYRFYLSLIYNEL